MAYTKIVIKLSSMNTEWSKKKWSKSLINNVSGLLEEEIWMPRVWKTFYNSVQVRRPSSGSHGREKLSLQSLREDVQYGRCTVPAFA